MIDRRVGRAFVGTGGTSGGNGMARHEHLLRVFVDFAGTLASDSDSVATGTELARVVVDELRADAAAVVLASGEGSPRVLAASSARGRLLAEVEIREGEGPGLDALRSGAPTARAPDAAARRWPRFASEIAPSGLRAFLAVPLRCRGQAVGALILATACPEAFATADVALVQAFADIAALAIMDADAATRALEVSAQLQTALDTRVVIEQAKGVVSERARIGIDDAFGAMRGYARRRSRLLTDIAREVVDGRLDGETVVREGSERSRHLRSTDRSGNPRAAP
jgi:GAF domain-containing protein